MALSLTLQPPDNVYTKDPVVFCFQSDDLFATAGTQTTITLNYPPAADAGTTTNFTINWGNGDVSTVILPPRSIGMTDAQYTAAMITNAQNDPFIALNCTVTTDPGDDTKFIITTNQNGYPLTTVTANLPIGGWVITTTAGTANTLNNIQIAAAVFVEEDYLSGNYKNITPKPLLFPLNPTTQITCIDISHILNQYALANNNMPDVPACNQGAITQNLVTNKRWLIKYYQVLNNVAQIVAVSPARRAIQGGMGFLNQYYNTHPIVNHLTPPALPTAGFLTHAPNNKQVTACQPEYLTYLVPADVTAIYISVTATNGTTDLTYSPNLEATNVTEGETYLIPVNPTVLEVLTAMSTATSYTVTVTDQNGAPISAPRNYIITAHTPYTRYFLFTNSIGGIDTIVTDTARTQTITSAIQEGIRSNPWNYTPYEGEYFTFAPSIQNSYNLTTQFVERCHAQYFQELILQSAWAAEVKYCGCCGCPDFSTGCLYVPIIVTNDINIVEEPTTTINWQYKEAFTSSSLTLQDCTQPIPPDPMQPTAVPDIYTFENCGEVVLLNVLSNDFDPQNNPITITSYTNPAQGTITNLGNGILQYEPTPGFIGTDNFTYTIQNPDGQESTTSVILIQTGCYDCQNNPTIEITCDTPCDNYFLAIFSVGAPGVGVDFISITIDGTTYTPPAPILLSDSAAILAYLQGLGLNFHYSVDLGATQVISVIGDCCDTYDAADFDVTSTYGTIPPTSDGYADCATITPLYPTFVCCPQFCFTATPTGTVNNPASDIIQWSYDTNWTTADTACINPCNSYDIWMTDNPPNEIFDGDDVISITIDGTTYTPSAPIPANDISALDTYFNGLGLDEYFIFELIAGAPPQQLSISMVGACGITYGAIYATFDNGAVLNMDMTLFTAGNTCAAIQALLPAYPCAPNQIYFRRTVVFSDSCGTQQYTWEIRNIENCGCYEIYDFQTTQTFTVATDCPGPGINLPPVTALDTITTDCNTPVTFDPLANDSDPDGTLDPTTVVIIQQPLHGTATSDPLTGEITYTPATNQAGNYSLIYQVADNDGATSYGTANIRVLACPPQCTITIGNITAGQCNYYGYAPITIPFSASNTGTTLTIAADAIDINYNVTAPNGTVTIYLLADGSTIPITITDNADPTCFNTTTYTLPNCTPDPCSVCNIEVTNVTITPATGPANQDGSVEFEIVPSGGCAGPYIIQDIVRQPGCYFYQGGANGTPTGLTACDTLITAFIAANVGNPTFATAPNTYKIEGLIQTGSLGGQGTPYAVSIADANGCVTWHTFFMYHVLAPSCTFSLMAKVQSGSCDAYGNYTVAVITQSLNAGSFNIKANGNYVAGPIPYSAGYYTTYLLSLNSNPYTGNVTLTVEDVGNPTCYASTVIESLC